jgi:hypothetical protein
LNAAAECVRALVFSDVENSTAQVARLGATGAVELWAAHDRKGDDRARRARLRARAATPKPLAARSPTPKTSHVAWPSRTTRITTVSPR